VREDTETRLNRDKIQRITMKFGITFRLFVSILAAAVLTVFVMFFVMQWNLDRGFSRYVKSVEKTRISRLAEQLEEKYSQDRGWSKLRRQPSEWYRLIFSSVPTAERYPRAPVPAEPNPDSLHLPGIIRSGTTKTLPLSSRFERRVFLLDADQKTIFSTPEGSSKGELKTLRVRGTVVGYLGVTPSRYLTDEKQLRFMEEQKLVMALTAGLLVMIGGCLSLLMATRLVRPIRELTTATNRLASGQYEVRVPVASSDELGLLARDFNMLALTLEMNEQARRQWVADISHELRTPLAILRGEIEAIQDGIRAATPDTIRSLHGEVMRLNRLVEDLYQLSLSDLGALTYRKAPLDPAALLSDVLTLFRAEFREKGICLEQEIPAHTDAPVFGDPERLGQLFTNLLDNSLKYTDPGGTLVVRLELQGKEALFDFQDSAPGVPDTELNRLFDRLYRVETSRNRSAGGAGIGLSLCKNIVEAHEGKIEALASPLGGVWIRVILPLAGKPC